MGKEQPFERGITCSVGSIDHEAATSISGGGFKIQLTNIKKDGEDMIYIFIWFILWGVCIVFAKHEFGSYLNIGDIGWCLTIAFIITIGIAYILSVIIFEYAVMEFTLEKEKPLYIIQDSMLTTGYFILGNGSINGDMKYVYMTEEDGGKCIKIVSTEDVIIYEQEGNSPRLEIWEGRCKNSFLRLFQIKPKKLIKIYIPQNAIKYEYNIDLR